jgi:hypothetical protein
MDNLNPPRVLIEPNVVDLNTSVRLDTFLSITDLDFGSEITRIQYRDNSVDGGAFRFGGDLKASNVWHETTGEQIGSILFRGASSFNRESISVRVFDGQFWSNTATGLITSGNSAPELTATDGRVTVNGFADIEDYLSYSDADNNPAVHYLIVDRQVDFVNGGDLVVNDTVNPQGQWLFVRASDLKDVVYRSQSLTGQSETISVRAFDGFAYSPTVDFRLFTSSAPVVVTGPPVNVLTNERTAASELFEVTDLDQDTIQTYLFVDRRPNANGGYFELNGVRQNSAEWFIVQASELEDLVYVGGSAGPQAENIGVIAYDGFEYSDRTEIEINTISRPTLTGESQTIQAGFYLNMATGGVANVSGTQPAGEPIFGFLAEGASAIDEYLFVDRRSNGGYFVKDGNRVPSATWFRVAGDELDQLEYFGANSGPTSEEIGVFAYTNDIWNDLGEFTIDTISNSSAPVLDLRDSFGRLGGQVTLAGMFGWSDADGDSLKSFRFFDSGDDPNSGYFTVNGVRQPALQFIELAWDQLDTVRYQLPNQAGSEEVRLIVNDGVFDSATATASVTTIGLPEIEATVNDLTVNTIERIPVDSVVSQVDFGPGITSYQLFDENTDFRSGRVELDGQDLQQGVVHTLSAADFSRLVFKGAEVDFGRQIDPVLIRGNNSVGWTEWERVNVNTDPVANRALESGFEVANKTAGPKNVITYSFIDGGNQGSYGTRTNPGYPPLPDYYLPGDDETLGTRPFSQEQREAFREVFENYERVANIDFVEVEYTLASLDSEIVIGAWGNFDGSLAGASAYAYFPVSGDGRGGRESDIWFNVNPGATGDFDPDTPTDVSLGSFFRFVAYHEIGHAVGLKHPFSAAPFLSSFTNFDYLTVMAYQHDSGFNKFDPYPDTSPASLMLYDMLELQRVYGANTDWNSGNNQYGNGFSGGDPHFVNNDEQHQTTLWDAGGEDALNYSSHVANETIDLRQGAWSSINGVQQSIKIAYDTIIENARGGSGDDNIRGNETANVLFGNDGNDVLRGGGDNDSMRGGAGDDTYIWSLGDGRDQVAELGGGGVDAIEVYSPSGEINSLEDDFTFRRFGNDLRIDFTFNQAGGQGTVTVADFDNDESRVELLRLYNGTGVQIGDAVDLQSIFVVATTLPQRFAVSDVQADTIANIPDVSNQNGFIAAPV